jgi:hypothetical protein
MSSPPSLGSGQRVGVAVYGLAVEGDGGERYHRREFQLEQPAPGSGQGLYDGALGDGPVAEPGDGVAATPDDGTEQRIVCAVGDAEEGLEVGQSDELGRAGGNGNADCPTTTACFT